MVYSGAGITPSWDADPHSHDNAAVSSGQHHAHFMLQREFGLGAESA
ncbi:MAG TPA: hypothetical protein VMF32_18820 [Xanthobacteraceae bacterium]|nr:hypothetical protein [Xanthobacteraceae bacterium]